MPEVALGVVRVVEPPLGDRRAGDRGVEHVGSAQHGERGEVAAEAPAADGDAVEVEHPGVVARQPRGSASTWSSSSAVGQIEVDGALPAGPRPRRAATVGDDDREALVGEPLRRQKAFGDRWTRSACGPPYGSSSTGSGDPSWSWGSSTAVAMAAFAGGEDL